MEKEIVINGTPIHFERYLARGNFGCVYLAYYGFEKVVVSMLNKDASERPTCKQLLEKVDI